jgi:DNA invertase Pin-like site-specific DNA recombinase
MKAVIYTRTSKDEVNEPRKSNSTQEAICRELANKNNDEIVIVRQDIGKSGSTEKLNRRKEFLKLLEDVKKLEIKRIYFLDYSRFSRSLMQQEKFITELQKLGVEIMPINDSKEKMVRQVQGIFNENMIDSMRTRTENEHKSRLQNNIHVSRPPMGYKKDKDSNKWIIDKRKAELVKRIFYLKMGNFSIDDISKQIKLPKITIKRILSNKSYLGIYVYRGKELGVFHEPIIEREVFDKCQN